MGQDPRFTLFGITEAQAFERGWRRDEYGEWRLYPEKRVRQPDDPPGPYQPPARDDGITPYYGFFYSAPRAQAAARAKTQREKTNQRSTAAKVHLPRR